MKKIITIKVHVDTDHPARQEWLEERHFIESEINEALCLIRGNYKKHSGISHSGATTFTLSVNHTIQEKNK
ncbi:hypothetical protein EV202_13127 [Bacteroides heparinolyticus]|uniref:Uncharacterized protein n=1 Tax=Prevotella heparinolytica TaxID=28113 RepID=A0A4R2LMI8_9BACE|nr:hypothetical protein [Bacteroides heparinolyticus]TCO87482.1 hypothetical protein EV202_13127 [Bacteroides heparinolyticus]